MPRRPLPEPTEPKRWLLRAFQQYTTRYLRGHFHAVRLLGDWPQLAAEQPVVIYLNHPSWWDPLICLELARHCCAARANYAPIDAAMLNRYAFMKGLGFFGVEQGSRRGAMQFLQRSESILRQAHTALWLTPQGRFADVRERPVRLAAGLQHLAQRVPEARYVPLALEYPFWTERRPEALAHFGDPASSPEHLARNLEEAQDRLASAAQTQAAEAFRTVLGGSSGEGGIYQAWRRLRSLWRGEKFQRAHGMEERKVA